MRADAERLVAPQFRQVVRLDRRTDPAADLRSGIAAHGFRPRRNCRRCGVCRKAARGRRCFKAADDAAALAGALQQEQDVESCAQALPGDAVFTELPHHRARARHLGLPICRPAVPRKSRRVPADHSTDAAVIAETAVLDFLHV